MQMCCRKPYKVFLLGGYDLEMTSIKQLLESRADCVIVDNHLQWNNAVLSAYQEELIRYSEVEIYGVELREDIRPPENYQRIDHHNDYNDRPAAILQVATILGIVPDRRIQLIAANDAGYIPAMQALGATEKEICEIRKQDRAAQGVTDAEESLAELSIAEGLTKFGELHVVRSQTSRFSAICDRLYPYSRLLVYTDLEWVFYGEGKMDIVAMCANEIALGKVYHGGGNNGYIGAAKGAFPPEHIHKFVKLIESRYEHI